MRTMLPLLLVLACPLAAQRPDSAQIARIMAMAQPGPEHQRLAALAGAWDVSFTSSMPGMAFTAVAHNDLILGGRFLSSRIGDEADGMGFKALTILGFDRGPGVYTAVGFDTLGTFYVTGAGPWDEANKRAVLAGSYDDPVTGHAHVYEFVWTVHSNDHYTWAIVFIEGDQRMTVMEGDYRRR
jgi:hypothetical protein